MDARKDVLRRLARSARAPAQAPLHSPSGSAGERIEKRQDDGEEQEGAEHIAGDEQAGFFGEEAYEVQVHPAILTCQADFGRKLSPYSHSIVPGGFDVMS
jgi:hypothetical protein